MAITLRNTKGSALTYAEMDANFSEVQTLMDKAYVSVTDYGAVGDGVTDDTVAINLAIDAVRNSKVIEEALVIYHTKTLFFPPGEYLVTGTGLDATNINSAGSVLFDCNGAVIYGNCPDAVVLDLTGSSHITINNLTIYSSSATAPRIGIQIGRKTTAVSNSHTFNDVSIIGHYTFACMYNYASEAFLGVKMELINKYNSSSAYCLVQDGSNIHDIQSDHTTITQAVGTDASFLANTFIKLVARKLTTGSPVWMTRTGHHRYIDCYVVTYDDAGVILYGESTYGNVNLYLDIQFETSGMTHCVMFEGVANAKVTQLYISDINPDVSTAFFGLRNGVTTVYIEGGSINIPSGLSAGTVFDDVTKYRIVGTNFIINDAADIGTIASFAEFSGIVVDRITATTTAYLSNAVVSGDSLSIETTKTPATAAATGTTGQIAWDASYLYVCTETDTWKRVAIATWP